MHSLHALFAQTFEYNLLPGSLVMFFLGFLMSFNPCMLGMASSVVALSRNVPQRGAQVKVGVVLTLAFVLTLVSLGGILAFFGKTTLQMVDQGEKFIGLVFFLLGLYLLGIRPEKGRALQLRSPLKVLWFYANKSTPAKGFLYLRGAGLGAFFDIIPQPCTTPALLAVVTDITAKEEVLPGLILLSAYGLGKGMIFILSGFLAEKLSKVRSSNLSRYIDRLLGLVLLVLAGSILAK